MARKILEFTGSIETELSLDEWNKAIVNWVESRNEFLSLYIKDQK